MKKNSTPSVLITTLAERALQWIQEQDLVIGARITEQSLCDALQVSRSPVRKALSHLAQEGWLEAIPNKGYRLISLTRSHHVGALPLSDDQLYLRIANDRIQGKLGEVISEAELIKHCSNKRFVLSRVQLQRVLGLLARDQLIDKKPARGWMFRPLLTDTAAHRESYRFRMVIEPAAILEPGYQIDLSALQKCRVQQADLLAGGIERCTTQELFAAGVLLHETIVAGSGNRFLLDALKRVNQMRRIVEYGTLLDRNRLHRQCEEHLQLIDLLLKGERMEAAQFLRQHLNTARITKLEQTPVPPSNA